MDRATQPEVASLDQLLAELSDHIRDNFQQRFPASKYDAVTRYRELLKGNFWPSDKRSGEYVRRVGVLFVNDRGNRMIFGEDIHAYFHKVYNPVTVYDDMLGKHIVHSKDRAVADQIQAYKSDDEKHMSENGKRLPENDHRHLLMIPAEIRLNILGFNLVAPGPITPQTMISTSEEYTLRPGYRDEQGGRFVTQEIRLPRSDEHGPYTEIRNRISRPIDATVLRTCKLLCAEGSELLYGKNEFTFFNTLNYFAGWQVQPTMDFIDSQLVAWCYHNHGMPSYTSLRSANGGRDYSLVVEDLMQYTDDEIPCWIYGDRFLHWIRTIGSTNAANVVKLGLGGDLPGHQIADPPSCTDKCQTCVQNRLRVYAGFVQKYCPHLRTLLLKVGDITFASAGQWGEDSLAPNKEKWEQVCLTEMSRYSSLRTLTTELWGGWERALRLDYAMVPRETKKEHRKDENSAMKRKVHLVEAELRRQQSPGCGFTHQGHLLCRPPSKD